MRKIICAACITAFTALAVIIAVCLFCLANEKQPSQKTEENGELPSERWKEYWSLVGIWPQLKKEGIESIRFCYAISPEYGYDTLSDFRENVNTFGYRERAAEVVRWWPTTNEVPKEKLSECIKIIDKAMKKAGVKGYRTVDSCDKMLIVTKKGKYIAIVGTHMIDPEAYGAEWESQKLGEFLVKYCMPTDGRGFFVLPEEQPAAILIFPMRNLDEDSYDSLLTWPPVVLFGDKKEAEKILDRSFEPKMTFEGGEWIDKIIDAYKIAMKDAVEKHSRGDKNAEDKRSRRKDVNAFEGWIVFLTPDEFYWEEIDIDENSVYGSCIIESKQLKAYFDELGITKELLAGEPNAVPQADKENEH